MADTINFVDGQVQIIFEHTDATTGLFLRDAIWLKQSQYETMSSSDIDAIKQGRIDDWVAHVNSPPVDSPA